MDLFWLAACDKDPLDTQLLSVIRLAFVQVAYSVSSLSFTQIEMDFVSVAREVEDGRCVG